MSSTPDTMLAAGLRVFLRPMTEDDATDDYVAWMNDPDVNRYLESRFTTHTKDGLRAFIRQTVADPRCVFMAICLTDGGRHIGNIKLGPVSAEHGHGDIGLIIGARDCRGKGYATEAISLIVKHAFHTLGLHKLTAGCYAENAASRRAFEKLGFLVEGIRRSHYKCGERHVDAVLLGMTNPAHA